MEKQNFFNQANVNSPATSWMALNMGFGYVCTVCNQQGSVEKNVLQL